MKKLLIFSLLIICTISCKGQETESIGNYYKKCIDKHLIEGGTDFYQKMNSIEDFMLTTGILEKTDRESYLSIFSKLLVSNQDFSGLHKNIKDEFYKDFNVKQPALYLFSLCSTIDINNIDSNCNCLNFQKHILKKFTFKSYDNSETIDDLFVFTDFDNNILRMHITYLFLLNMEIKYGNE